MDNQLLFAASKGDLAAVRAVLAHGADVHACGEDGRTALHYAVMQRRADIALVLLHAGANPRARSMDGLSALDLAQPTSRRP